MDSNSLRYCSLDQVNPHVLALSVKSKNDQRSDSWLSSRKKLLTASDIATVLDQTETSCGAYITAFPDAQFEISVGKPCNPYSNKTEFYLRKCGKGIPFLGNEATLFGQLYEPIAQQVYQQVNRVDLIEFGLIPDPENPWLAASPDGITTAGVNVEIKCPLNRVADPIPPIGYWIQMQIQMQTCGMESCDYICCSFVEFLTEESWVAHFEAKPPELRHDNGVLLYGIVLSDSDRNQKEYAGWDVNTIADYITWAREHPRASVLSPRYYALNAFFVTRVARDRKWFQDNVNDLKSVWQMMRHHQENQGSTIELPVSKRRKQDHTATMVRPCLF